MPLPQTRAQHYREAESLLAQASAEFDLPCAQLLVALAQVHAALANVAEEVYGRAYDQTPQERDVAT